MGFSVVAAVVAVVLAPAALAGGWEKDTDRPGGDYRDIELARPDPGLCEVACGHEERCQAWTYVKPGVQGEGARCWLKEEVPEAVESDCCVSGVKRPKGMEVNTDRPGGDYHDFEVPQAAPGACQAACDREQRCRAWTYVKPGVQGESAHCWLKEEVPEAVESDCCISGVK